MVLKKGGIVFSKTFRSFWKEKNSGILSCSEL